MNFTVVLKQNNVAVASTTNHAVYTARDGWVTAHVNISADAAGTVGTQIKLTPSAMPAPAANFDHAVGVFRYTDTGTALYVGNVYWSGTDISFVSSGETNFLGATPSFAMASTDELSLTFTFKAA